MDVLRGIELQVALGAALVAVLLVAAAFLARRRRFARRGTGAATASGGFRFGDLGRGFAGRMRAALSGGGEVDERLAAVEEVLLKADVGVRTTGLLLEKLRPRLVAGQGADSAIDLVAEDMLAILGSPAAGGLRARPYVVLVSGVNGVGKTTSVAKLANYYKRQGLQVLLVAADTFRAAAAAQLANWANRLEVDCVRHDEDGADPSAVVYDGMQAARSRGADVVIVDTAGRLHVKANLVAELQKIARTIGRQIEGAPHESLLVIDATTGQNASNQARAFAEALPLTGILLTKLDGTAKGGSVFAVQSELGLPIRYVGFGEGIDDLAEFDPRSFVAGLLDRERDATTD
jgi:fused signal recognition particle receptor